MSITTDRVRLLRGLTRTDPFDMLIIGGGATGLGIAVDAANRGLSVALVEAEDFAKGTSSRATKMLHGGVRYLAQGDISLVYEALRERTAMLKNAPHLASTIPFLMPVYGAWGRWVEKSFYGAGLIAYDMMSGKSRLGKTKFLSAQQTIQRMPGVQSEGLTGAVEYWDGQFDDARLAVALARTAAAQGAHLINHCRVTELLHEENKIAGAQVTDAETGLTIDIKARCVINATGVWVDSIRQMDRKTSREMVAPSQGVHLVVDAKFLGSEHALLVPKTKDGRVVFAVPWMGKVILGTTDTPRDEIDLEPRALPGEVQFILEEAGNYLSKRPTASDVRSVWGGLRPLVRPPDDDGEETKGLSREHTVLLAKSGLVTVTGGKWTTYRAMAEDVIEQCEAAGLLRETGDSKSIDLALVGAPDTSTHRVSGPPGMHLYGTENEFVAQLPGSDRELVSGVTEAMVRFAVRYEFARTVEDVLARRSRLLFLDAKAAIEAAEPVAQIIQDELGGQFDASRSVSQFKTLANRYLIHT